MQRYQHNFDRAASLSNIGVALAQHTGMGRMMFSNYLKTTFRDLTRNKLFASVNILGLSVGFLCMIYIVLFVYDELSFDKHRIR